MTGRSRPHLAADGVDGRLLRVLTKHTPDPAMPLFEAPPLEVTELDDVVVTIDLEAEEDAPSLRVVDADVRDRADDFLIWRARHQRLHRRSVSPTRSAPRDHPVHEPRSRPSALLRELARQRVGDESLVDVIVPVKSSPSKWWTSRARRFADGVAFNALIACARL